MIGMYPGDEYAVSEFFQLFKVPWEWFKTGHAYDLLLDPVEIPTIQILPEIFSKGSYDGDTPFIDREIDLLRQRIKDCSLLVEIPPVPWGHPYMVAVTHDVDSLSLREKGFLSTGYMIYRCLKKKQIIDALRIVGTKLHLIKDPWDYLDIWIKLENYLKIRSTFFFLPSSHWWGLYAPKSRAGRYTLKTSMINDLTMRGWEVGVHTIDAWHDALSGREELYSIYYRTFPDDPHPIGSRSHWLLFDAKSWPIMDLGKYDYDSSMGYNNTIGFRAGTLQVYQPKGTTHLLELPLHIQDISLFESSTWDYRSDRSWFRTPCLHLKPSVALGRCFEIFDYAKQYGGVVTILWHYERIFLPYYEITSYTNLIIRALYDRAWVTRANTIVEWFRSRRSVSFVSVQTTSLADEKQHGPQGVSTISITVTSDGSYLSNVPPCEVPFPDSSISTICPLSVRVHIDPKSVISVSDEYVCGEDFIDVKYIPSDHTLKAPYAIRINVISDSVKREHAVV